MCRWGHAGCEIEFRFASSAEPLLVHCAMVQVLSVPSVAVVGGGPAGLMAAEVLAANDFSVDLYDAMPSIGRKFLLAGKGGLNLTHSEEFEPFVRRYAQAEPWLRPMLTRFGAGELRCLG